MSNQHRVTQREIAERAGVHRSTVSLALKNHIGIPEETRDKILRIAEEMGYSPDPMLSALAMYRSRKRPQAFHGTLAWLINSATGANWQRVPAFLKYFEGASYCAKKHGFILDVFDVNAPKMTPKRMTGILRARNISGILVCPGKIAENVIRLDWQQFSAVSLSHSLKDPLLHVVRAAHYRNMGNTLSELHRRGYRRVGILIDKEIDAKIDDSYLSRFLSQQYLLHESIPIPPLFGHYGLGRENDAIRIRKWIKAHRIEVIVVFDGERLKDFPATMNKLGYRIPKDIGIACAGLATPDTGVSGTYEEPFWIGESAMNFLVHMIHRGERGVPHRRQQVHLEGSWSEGTTLKSEIKRPHSSV